MGLYTVVCHDHHAFFAEASKRIAGHLKKRTKTVLEWHGNAVHQHGNEILFSVFFAPIRMLCHTKFVLFALLGKTIEWSPQRRSDRETGWLNPKEKKGLLSDPSAMYQKIGTFCSSKHEMQKVSSYFTLMLKYLFCLIKNKSCL